MSRVLPPPVLTTKGPYPFRMTPQPNPWLKMLKPAASTPATGASAAAARGANDERGMEREIGEGEPKPKHHEAADGIFEDHTERLPQDQFELWHEASVLATAEATVDLVADSESDVARRAQFDREQADRRRHIMEKRHAEREHDIGR